MRGQISEIKGDKRLRKLIKSEKIIIFLIKNYYFLNISFKLKVTTGGHGQKDCTTDSTHAVQPTIDFSMHATIGHRVFPSISERSNLEGDS